MDCVVPGCWNTTLDRIYTFFDIPANGAMRQEWLLAIGREDLLNEPPNRRYSICEVHFPQDAIWVIKHLRPGAFPTQHIPNGQRLYKRPYYNVHPPENFTPPYCRPRQKIKAKQVQNTKPTIAKEKPQIKTEPGILPVKTEVKSEKLNTDILNMTAQINSTNSNSTVTSKNSSTPANNNFLDVKIKKEPTDYNDNCSTNSLQGSNNNLTTSNTSGNSPAPKRKRF